MKKILWISTFLTQVNNFREEYSLPPVTFNFTVAEKLQSFEKEFGAAEFYRRDENEYFHYVELLNRNQTNVGDGLMEKLGITGWSHMFHDTMKKNRMKAVISYRLGQEKCFDWRKCNRTKYYDHITCLINPPVIIHPEKCIWSWYYLPKFLYNFSELSCIQMHYTTMWVPDGVDQNYCFYCYFNYAQHFPDSDSLAVGLKE